MAQLEVQCLLDTPFSTSINSLTSQIKKVQGAALLSYMVAGGFYTSLVLNTWDIRNSVKWEQLAALCKSSFSIYLTLPSHRDVSGYKVPGSLQS